ncbi:MAG: RDD family protein [Dehalococcoidia bacterium]
MICSRCGLALTLADQRLGAKLCPQCSARQAGQPWPPQAASTAATLADAPPQSPYASWGTRFIAYLIDSVLGLIIAAAIAGVAVLIMNLVAGLMDASERTLDDATAITFAFMLTPLFFAYLCLGDAYGRTIGKRMLGIGVIGKADNRRIGLLRAVLRQIVRLAGYYALGIGWLSMIWDDDKQAWHDKAANDVVVWNPVYADGPSSTSGLVARWSIIGGAAAFTAVILGVAVGLATEPDEGTALVVQPANAGDCLQIDDEGLFSVVACTSGDADVVVLEVLEMPGDTAYPGEDEIIQVAEEGCPLEAEYYYYPLPSNWSIGDRQIVCVAERP